MLKVKICGFTNVEDYEAALGYGIDYAGFIFYGKSPRCIDKHRAQEIVGRAGDAAGAERNTEITGLDAGSSMFDRGGNDPMKVGVFVNEDIDRVREICEFVGLDIVQLHGDESPAYCKELGIRFWKAIRLKDEGSLALLDDYDCDAFLLDSYARGSYGGTGKPIDIELAERAIQTGRRIIIAGGISLDTIDRIIELSPFGVDINSMIESRPGKKDHRKLKQLLMKIKREVPRHEA